MQQAKIGLAFISDREDKYLPTCMESLDQHVDYYFKSRITIDDRHHSLGLAGAARAAWQWAVDMDLEYLFHVEEDFQFVRDVPIQKMVDILTNNIELAQVVLARQPWNSSEQESGGVIKHLGSQPRECNACDLKWSTQRTIFSLNPCLIPRDILEIGWPDSNEAGMTEILRYRGYEFAFLGHPDDDPYVHHIGQVRGSGWKL